MRSDDILFLTFATVVIIGWFIYAVSQSESFNKIKQKIKSKILLTPVWIAYVIVYALISITAIIIFALCFTALPMWLFDLTR